MVGAVGASWAAVCVVVAAAVRAVAARQSVLSFSATPSKSDAPLGTTLKIIPTTPTRGPATLDKEEAHPWDSK